MANTQDSTRSFSFEFFPPHTPEGKEKLCAATAQLAQLDPKFFSVTFGAGGSTRDRTLATVLDICGTGHAAAPHISCIALSEDEIRGWLQRYRDNGVKHIVALRGDPPSGLAAGGAFRYANELVEFVRREFGDAFTIDVAAYPEFHPQASSARDDLLAFKRKVDAGADSAITQYFYNADAYYRFIDECQAMGINIPIVPGIMPIGRFSQLARFSDTCGAEIPRWLRKKLESYGDDIESIRAFGLDVVTALCQDLLRQGAPGLHFYTLNQAALTTAIWQRLGL